jgi:uncharacterized protein YneF (UPF0154 family)
MRFDIEFYNTAVGITWGLVVFLLGGMFITRKRGR